MKYAVFWAPEAESQLAALWADAAKRQAVTDAANTIDQMLVRDPEELGEWRPDGARTGARGPRSHGLAVSQAVAEFFRSVTPLPE